MKQNTLISAFAGILLMFTTNSFAGDGYLTSVSINPYIKAGKSYDVSCNVRNNNNNGIKSFKVAWKLKSSSTVHRTNLININGNGITKSTYYSLTHPQPLKITSEGDFTLKIWLEAGNESNPGNDTVTVNSTAIKQSADKTTLFEVFTATWCQYCPPANSVANEMAKNNDVAVAKFHNRDELSISEGEQYFRAYYSGGTFTPGGIMNMGKFGKYPVNSQHPSWKDEVSNNSKSVSPISVNLSNNLESSARKLTVNVTADFKYAEKGNYYINAYILESGIDKPQTNAPSNYKHDYVVREMLGGSNGTSGVIPSSPSTGKKYEHTYTFTIPSEWNTDKLSVIGVVFQKKNGEKWAANAAKQEISSGGNPSSIGDHSVEARIKVYPNPFEEKMTIEIPGNAQPSAVNIYSADGRKVFEKTISTNAAGSDITLNPEDKQLPAGIYTLQIRAGGNTYTKRLAKF